MQIYTHTHTRERERDDTVSRLSGISKVDVSSQLSNAVQQIQLACARRTAAHYLRLQKCMLVHVVTSFLLILVSSFSDIKESLEEKWQLKVATPVGLR